MDEEWVEYLWSDFIRLHGSKRDRERYRKLQGIGEQWQLPG
jgi:hypothetical protein